MFVNKPFTYLSRALISKSKRCFNLKSSTYYFHIKTKISADFQICISVPLKITVWKTSIVHIWSFLVHIIPAFGLNARKYEPEKLQIGTLFTHWKSNLFRGSETVTLKKTFWHAGLMFYFKFFGFCSTIESFQPLIPYEKLVYLQTTAVFI